MSTRAVMLGRLLLVQAAWNYDGMISTGIGFALEPALRLLPGGKGGDAYRAAIARESTLFNCHPYLAAMAVGALARVELDGEAPARITRFRSALCGPLGSVGDRLIWAAWLPACSLLGLVLWGLGVPPTGAVLAFVFSYNLGHVALRLWGLQTGWQQGLKVSASLGVPVLRDGPGHVAQGAAVLAGLALPLVIARTVGSDYALSVAALVFAIAAGYVVARLHGRVYGWMLAFVLLTLQVFASVLL